MTNQNPVAIDSEPTRRVLCCVLWQTVSEHLVGERGLSDACFSLGWRSIHPSYALDDDLAEVEYRLARIAIIRRAVRRVQLAPLGECVTLPVSDAQVEEALDECVRTIDQSQELLDSLGEEDRAGVLACRQEAQRLAARLRERPEAREADQPAAADACDEPPDIGVPEFDSPVSARRLRELERLIHS